MKTRKIISLILAVVLISMSLATGALAADKPYYVVLGDSIAYGSGLSNPVDACYGKMIADTCGFDYANYSVPGATTNALIQRLGDETVIAAVSEADIISISIGGNDFLMNNIVGLMFEAIVKKDYTTFDEIGEGVYTNIGEIISIIRAVNGDALILLQTLYNPQEGYLKEPYQQGADRINAAIYRWAQENPGEAIVVDVGTALGDDAENFAGDAVHPSAKGNRIIAGEILSCLNGLGVTDKTELAATVEGEDVKISPLFSGMFSFYGFFFHVLSLVLGPVFSIFK
ncbi:MAG: SGNH/GDSL hydrolase family protein [Clostridia bacterium]|nr:SGNH/GDSL hydrolase family protein [Clostridia bacterium]